MLPCGSTTSHQSRRAHLGSPHSQAGSPDPLHFDSHHNAEEDFVADALPQSHNHHRPPVPFSRQPRTAPSSQHTLHHNSTSAATVPHDVTVYLADLLGDAAEFAISRVEVAMAVINAEVDAAASDSKTSAVRSLLQLLSDLAAAAAQRHLLLPRIDAPPPSTRPRDAAAGAAGKRVSIAFPVSTLSVGPFRSMTTDHGNSPSAFGFDDTSSDAAPPKHTSYPVSPKPFRVPVARGKRQALCFADSGIFRRQSTAFLTRASVGDEEDDGTFTINQHIVLMQLGRGAQGEVFLAMDGDANELRAIKAIRRPAAILTDAAPRTALELARDSKRAQLQREIAIMKKCRHRNIVSLYEVIDDPSLDVMYLVMQYVDKGPIATMRSDGTIEKRIDGGVLADYALQIAKGLRYLHRSGIIHRDIKPDNILLGSKGDVYLADFGVSELFDDGGGSSVAGTRGTLAFLAPELFVMNKGESSMSHHSSDMATMSVATTTRSPEVNGEAVDVWALGVTLYTLLFGRVPWRSTTVAELITEISSGSITFPDDATVLQITPTTPPSFANSAPPPPLLAASSSPLHSFRRSDWMTASSLATASAPPIPDPMAATRRVDSERRLHLSDGDTTGHQQWTPLLRGMLHPDPTARWSLASVLTAVAAIHEAAASSTLDAPKVQRETPSNAAVEPITTVVTRHRRSSRFMSVGP